LNPTGPGSTLRPLGVGEVLDRAVNLCVKHFVPLTLIFLVYAIPLAVIQYFASKDSTTMLQALVTTLESGKSADPAAISKQLNAAPGPNVWIFVLLLIRFFIAPLPAAALIVAAAAFYLGRPTSFGDAYRAALPRWPQLVGLNFLYGFAAGFLYLAVAIATFVIVLGVVFLYAASHVTGIVIGIVVGAIATILVLAVCLVVALAWQVSYFACVLEQQNFAVAFVSGIQRVFKGVGLQRALLVGLAYVAILIGITLVSGLGETLLIGLVHSAVAGTVYTTIVRVATAAFTTAFIAIFYYDLRVREEGLDLQLAAQAAPVVPVVPAES
jgi:hypothetical protein